FDQLVVCDGSGGGHWHGLSSVRPGGRRQWAVGDYACTAQKQRGQENRRLPQGLPCGIATKLTISRFPDRKPSQRPCCPVRPLFMRPLKLPITVLNPAR